MALMPGWGGDITIGYEGMFGIALVAIYEHPIFLRASCFDPIPDETLLPLQNYI